LKSKTAQRPIHMDWSELVWTGLLVPHALPTYCHNNEPKIRQIGWKLSEI
jgi:hypothetical protein